MLAEARLAGDSECCGLLLGASAHCIDAHCPAVNVAADTARHFEIDPVTLIAAEKEMRAGGVKILGYYHSHPVGDAVPSPTDIAMAPNDGRIWAIIAQNAVRLWVKELNTEGDGQFTEISYKCG